MMSTLTTGVAVARPGARGVAARLGTSSGALKKNVVRGDRTAVTPIFSCASHPPPFSSPFPSIVLTAVRRGRTLVRAAAPGDDDIDADVGSAAGAPEELDVDKVLKEMTDTSNLGGRGEVFFLGQSVLLFLLVFTPGGGALEDVGSVQKDAFDPLFGLVLVGFAGVLLTKVGALFRHPPVYY